MFITLTSSSSYSLLLSIANLDFDGLFGPIFA
jgi:hypothetical protein